MTLHIDNIRPYDATQKNTQAAGTTAAAYNTTDFVRFGDISYNNGEYRSEQSFTTSAGGTVIAGNTPQTTSSGIIWRITNGGIKLNGGNSVNTCTVTITWYMIADGQANSAGDGISEKSNSHAASSDCAIRLEYDDNSDFTSPTTFPGRVYRYTNPSDPRFTESATVGTVESNEMNKYTNSSDTRKLDYYRTTITFGGSNRWFRFKGITTGDSNSRDQKYLYNIRVHITPTAALPTEGLDLDSGKEIVIRANAGGDGQTGASTYFVRGSGTASTYYDLAIGYQGTIFINKNRILKMYSESQRTQMWMNAQFPDGLSSGTNIGGINFLAGEDGSHHDMGFVGFAADEDFNEGSAHSSKFKVDTVSGTTLSTKLNLDKDGDLYVVGAIHAGSNAAGSAGYHVSAILDYKVMYNEGDSSDTTDDYFTVNTSYDSISTSFKANFTAISSAVELEVSFTAVGESSGDTHTISGQLSTSSNPTGTSTGSPLFTTTVTDTIEYRQDVTAGTDPEGDFVFKWTIIGLTAGNSYEFWPVFKSIGDESDIRISASAANYKVPTLKVTSLPTPTIIRESKNSVT